MFGPEVTTSSAHMETHRRHGSFRGDTLRTSASDREVTLMYCAKNLSQIFRKSSFNCAFGLELAFWMDTLCTFKGKWNISL